MLLPGMERPSADFHLAPWSVPVRYIDGRVRIWDWQRKQPMLEVSGAEHPGRLDFSPDSRWLAVIDPALKVVVYDLSQRQPLSLAGPTAKQREVRFDPTGTLLAACNAETITILDANSGNMVGVKMRYPGLEVRALGWHPDGRHLASACGDRLVCLWDIQSGE